MMNRQTRDNRWLWWSMYVLGSALLLGGLAGCGTSEDPVDETDPSANDLVFAGEIDSDMTWPAGSTVVLTDLVFVTGGATLTIEPGVTVLGDGGSALVVTRGAKIDAQGTASEPIVFTSSKEAGARRRGDWGGVVLLGEAPINVPAGSIEGIDATDDRGTYGGSDMASDCGTLRYARIEFAGFEIAPDNELNGLTVGGCGSATTLDHIQIHMGDDDGIEFFGGAANVRHLVVTRAADDSIDWDEGWTGKAQFVLVQQEGAEGDNGIEADNLEADNEAAPRSAPTLSNLTFIGSNDPSADQRAMTLRRGTAGFITNSILMGFPREAIDLRDPATITQLEGGALVFDGILLFDIGADGTSYFAEESGEDDDDGGFVEADHFMGRATHLIGQDPMLADPYNLTSPGAVPSVDSPVAGAAVPVSDGWFESVDHLGAFAPGGEDWTAGWTAFPEH